MTPSVITNATQADWDQVIATNPSGHLLQTGAWGELKSAFGWQAEPVATPAGYALVLFRPLPLGLGTLAYVPRGPVLDWHDPAAARALLPALDAACRRRRAVLLKVEPWLEDDPEYQTLLRDLGFRLSPHAVQARRTVLVNIAPDEDAILASMKSKTRYNVRLATRKGVTVHPATRTDLPAFHALMAATATRDNFAVHTPEYYEKAFEELVEKADLGVLLLARGPETATTGQPGGEPHAALFAAACGSTAVYLYGASGDAGRELMPTYLLQWEAIRWAKARGCTTYDLLGVPDEDEATLESQFESRHDGLWGVYRFKRGFGGRLFRTVGAWDRVYNPALYWAYRQVAARRGVDA